MGQLLSWSLRSREGTTVLALAGELNEKSNLSSAQFHLPEEVVIDLSGIIRINSWGLRHWLRFLTALRAAGKRFVLDRCSVAVVMQLNMVANFRGGAEVRSIFAPYHCPRCASDAERLIRTGKDAAAQIDYPFPCPRCGTEMEFDDLPESYLTFQRSPEAAPERPLTPP
jgi:eukaryotic-like serine/threonine-protein kinase